MILARLDALKLLNWRMVNAVQDGTLTPQERLRGQGVRLRGPRDAYAWLMEIVGAAGALKEGSAGAVLHGELERGYRSGGDLHLRRRQQRDPAGDHLVDRTGDAPGPTLTPCDAQPWMSEVDPRTSVSFLPPGPDGEFESVQALRAAREARAVAMVSDK